MKRILRVLVLSLLLLLPSCNTAMPNNYVTLSYSEIKERQNNGESIIFFGGTSYCQHCLDFKDLLKVYLQSHEEYTMYYLDMERIGEADFLELFEDMNEFFIANNRDDNVDSYGERYFGTPTTFVYENGVYTMIEMGVQNETILNNMFESIQ